MLSLLWRRHLGEHLQAWIVHSPQEAQESIAQFQQHHLGKGCFLPLQLPRHSEAAFLFTGG